MHGIAHIPTAVVEPYPVVYIQTRYIKPLLQIIIDILQSNIIFTLNIPLTFCKVEVTFFTEPLFLSNLSFLANPVDLLSAMVYNNVGKRLKRSVLWILITIPAGFARENAAQTG